MVTAPGASAQQFHRDVAPAVVSQSSMTVSIQVIKLACQRSLGSGGVRWGQVGSGGGQSAIQTCMPTLVGVSWGQLGSVSHRIIRMPTVDVEPSAAGGGGTTGASPSVHLVAHWYRGAAGVSLMGTAANQQAQSLDVDSTDLDSTRLIDLDMI